MTETTWVGPWDDEVMVQTDEQDAVIDVYCSYDSPLITEADTLTGPKVEWVEGKNPLFRHATDPAAAIELLRHLDYIEGDRG